MLTEFLISLPDLLVKLVPAMFLPAARLMVKQATKDVNPEKVQQFDRDFEGLLDAISAKNETEVVAYLNRYNIQQNGSLAKIIYRAMGYQ